jgi:hypothetical protein
MEDNRLPKQLLNYHPKRRRLLKRLLDDMTAETETGHPGLNSWWNMIITAEIKSKRFLKSWQFAQLVNKFLGFYETKCFIALFIIGRHWTLSLGTWIESAPNIRFTIYFNIFVSPYFTRSIVALHFQIKTVFMASVRAIRPAHLHWFDLSNNIYWRPHFPAYINH